MGQRRTCTGMLAARPGTWVEARFGTGEEAALVVEVAFEEG